MIGYAMCGSFCTLGIALDVMKRLVASGLEIQPIMSENAYFTNTRFFEAEQLRRRVEAVTGKNIISNVVDAEPLGPKLPLEALIIAPCTGNTLAKMANGITDTAVTMAAKAHLRSDRPLLIALASNDALSQNLASIGAMLNRKSVYFVPLRQDDPIRKPHSLVADFERIQEALEAMLRGRQLRPMFV
jgi:dipicolinate synthase subunit B